MNVWNIVIVGTWTALTVIFLARVGYQLVCGKLTTRDGKIIANRRENPRAYWFRIGVEVVMGAAMVAMLILGFDTLLDWRTLWH